VSLTREIKGECSLLAGLFHSCPEKHTKNTNTDSCKGVSTNSIGSNVFQEFREIGYVRGEQTNLSQKPSMSPRQDHLVYFKFSAFLQWVMVIGSGR
jgi:hypothetical protein